MCRRIKRQCTFNAAPVQKSAHNREQPERRIDEVSQSTSHIALDGLALASWQQDILILRSPILSGPDREEEENDASPEAALRTHSLEAQSSTSHHVCGWTGESSPLLLTMYSYNEHGEHKLNKLSFRQVSHELPTYFTLTDKELTNDLFRDDSEQEKLLRAQLEILVSLEEGQQLVGLFFKYVHPSLPILRERPIIGDLSSTPTGILASIYLLALPFTLFAPSLACHSYGAYQRPSSKELFDIGYKCYSYQLHAPGISTIQTALLLLQAEPIHYYFSDAVFYSGFVSSLYSISQMLGLNIDCSKWRIPTWEKKLRKRIWWFVFCTEKWTSMSCGRSSHINDTDWDVSPLTDDDFDVHPSSQFCILCSLTLILSDVISQLYTLTAVKERVVNGEKTLQLTKSFITRLRDLYSTIDPKLQMDSMRPTALSTAGSLNLCFLGLEILLAKSYIEVSKSELRKKTEPPYIIAIKLLNFMKSLRVEHTKAFWYSWCRQIFASGSSFLAFLVLSSNSSEEAGELKMLLENWRWHLQIQASDFAPVRLGLGRIDGWVGLERLSEMPETFKPFSS